MKDIDSLSNLQSALESGRGLSPREARIPVLITGGAGFIGSHTAKALARAGYEPVVFDNLSTGHRSAVKWGKLIEADLADDGAVRAAMREHRIQAVIHCAGSALVGESMSNPGQYF